MDIGDYWILLAVLFLGFAIGGLAAEIRGRGFVKKQAIQANVAEWRIDAKTGEKEFVFKECEE